MFYVYKFTDMAAHASKSTSLNDFVMVQYISENFYVKTTYR